MMVLGAAAPPSYKPYIIELTQPLAKPGPLIKPERLALKLLSRPGYPQDLRKSYINENKIMFCLLSFIYYILSLSIVQLINNLESYA